MENLGISLGQLISQIVNFGLLAALLSILLYKPVLNMLRERQERVARSMADADEAREHAQRAQQEYDRRITEAQRKAQEIIGQAAQAGEKAAAEIRANAQREAETIREKARQEANEERERILSDVQSQIATLSLLATERVLGQAVDENLQRRLIDESLRELGGAIRSQQPTGARDGDSTETQRGTSR